ncbi:SusC/RagA family TonB-linked outer membrane protein [Pedobacter sp. MC2016-14]|uniref:SusC/RagA family TonB-linked outer membrane protein n=1 Tax=Pedobacter sp. MC2016-14 TaxID=2897327 RepID=UPI001E4D8F7B|nr:SusC/RagA family TonB-linked outer membrane protein [Pedobacter sp. MC2016-14]MCD0490532.1 SusC/RagA family TonB-linked outer membrane protein [Pedobacter sp. MC2016-14]
MKLTTFILIVALTQLSAKGFGQKINLTIKDAPLEKVLTAIKNQTGYVFFYSGKDIQKTTVTVNLKNAGIEEALTACFKNLPFTYTVSEKNILIKQKEPSFVDKITAVFSNIDVRGQVQNKEGIPLVGASITVKGTNRRVLAGANGIFILPNVDEDATIVITYLGYSPQEVILRRGMVSMVIIMQLAENKMDDVIITGTGINRKKDSFTGAATTFSGLELKAVGNKNVLESLKSLDPSFIKIDNNLQGSNPNNLPSFEVRGRTSINTGDLNNQFNSNPNQPLFILDGFESTLQTIYDLDMNRVASITILKDAASTALYGAKASNGVVVVETKRPVPGQLQISYTGDFSVEMPDLSSYNLMNAAEKLEFERLAGVYRGGQFPWLTEEKYNDRLAEIQRGVNTYWLNEPVNVAFTNRQSLQLGGGNNDLLFNAGASYGNQAGVMKGSGRESWSGNVNLTYRKGRINIINMLSVSGNKGTESPYGSFTAFANANPYYRKQLEDGTIPKYLDPVYDRTVFNPLYNASLESINETNAFSLLNNTAAILTLSDAFRLQGGIQLGKGSGSTVRFIPPDNSAYEGIESRLKGNYTAIKSTNSSLNGNLMLTFSKAVEKHQITASVRGDIQRTFNEGTGFSVTGFPFGTNGNPAFAFNYVPASTPTSSTVESRSVGLLASANYGYDQRFLVDLIYRLDGASAFGQENLFKPFVSGGIGWNLNREQFLKNASWINLLKLRANLGVTGNENLGQFSSVSTYVFQSGNNNNFGQGLSLVSLGNPSLDWQKTVQGSYGADFSFFNSRISGYLEYFNKDTDPLAVPATGVMPSSAGVNSNYVLNVGSLQTKGWNFNLRVSPIYNLEKRVIWSIGIMGSNYSSAYGGLQNSLSAFNTEELNNNGLNRYYDGYSPDDIWAVLSRGVDPATGKEIFQKKDGSLTFTYDPADVTKVGNSRPNLEGTINTSLTYKDFTFSAIMRYRFGGDVFNSAIYDKVENISTQNLIYNQDRRALYDRWQKPGDVAQFVAIADYIGSPMSSRFVENDSHIIGESFNVSWRSYAGWIKKLRLQSLGLSFYANDIFRIEKVQTERGIQYPYARSASFSINATF